VVINSKFLMEIIEKELRSVLVDSYPNEQESPVKELFIRDDFHTEIDSQALTLITNDDKKFLILATQVK